MKSKKEIEARKEELIAIKKTNSEAWTKELQDELDEIVSSEIDLSELIDEIEATLPKTVSDNGYKVPDGTEKMIHLSIARGRRFNPKTGKDETKAYTQIFSVNEFNLFKKNANLLGYSILKALHDPTGEANKLLVK